MFDLVIRGRWIDPIDGEGEGSIGIRQGQIVRLGGTFNGKREITLGDREFLFPGFIDPHVHLREPGWTHKEDFHSGTRAAVKGGVTTVLDMPNNGDQPAITRERLAEKHRLSGRAVIDVGFFGGVKHPLDVERMRDFVSGYKVYLGETTGDLGMTMTELEPLGPVLGRMAKTVMFHTRTPEADGVKEVIEFVQKHRIRVHFTHLARKSAVRALETGMTADVTPHHLLFTAEDREEQPDLRMRPSLGEDHDRAALLEALIAGKIHMLATDHAPHTRTEQKASWGVPGLEVYGNVAAWLLSQGMDPVQLAKATSLHAAVRFGLGEKGRIAEGSQADLVVLKLEDQKVQAPYETKCNWSPYEGMIFPGGVSTTIHRGRVVMENGALV